MYYLRWLLLTGWCVALAAGAGHAGGGRPAPPGVTSPDAWAMRWRVFCDQDAGYSFRYPYDYDVKDQYSAVMRRQRGGIEVTSGPVQIVIKGKKITIPVTETVQSPVDDLKAFSVTLKDIPSDIKSDDLSAVHAKMLRGAGLSWTSFDYYQVSPARPQGDVKWALAGIQAMIGEGPKDCGLVVRYGDRFSGIILTGKLAEFDNQRILDSFEVLACGDPKAKPQVRSAGGVVTGTRLMTWREKQGKLGHPFDGADSQIKQLGGRSGKTAWAKAWDVETQHYHITTSVSSQRLMEYGGYLEALYKAYIKVYEPEIIPPYKLEIHLFTSQQEFMEAAAAHGFPISSGVGGFFVPSLLSIFTFEETAIAFGRDVKVESVLAHECSHQFLHMSCNGSDHVPTWISEGLAVYFESGVFSNGNFNIQSPKDRVASLKQMYSMTKSTLMPLDQYINHNGHIPGECYGEVYAMVHYWVFGDAGGLVRFRKYWKALKEHQDGAEAFERIFMDDMIKKFGTRDKAVEEWQKALVRYVLQVLK